MCHGLQVIMYFIRTASERDLPAIHALLVAAYDAVYTPIHGREKVAELNAAWNSPDVLRQLIRDPAGEFLVADSGTEIGGIAYACPSRSKPATATLAKLYVHPDRKRKGIGGALFAEVETCFPEAKTLRLEVDVSNPEAIAFYEAHGMSIVGRTENCGTAESGIPAHIMEKTLDPLR